MKLTEDDFKNNSCEVGMIINCTPKEYSKLKQQILENQKIVDELKRRKDHIKNFGDSTGRKYWNSWVYQELKLILD